MIGIGDSVLLVDVDFSGCVSGLVLPKYGLLYTVREIDGSRGFDKNKVGILLEEIVNRSHDNGKEYCYRIDRFRKVEFPEAFLAELEELIELDEVLTN